VRLLSPQIFNPLCNGCRTEVAAKPELTVLLSGRGSNMQAIHKACEDGRIDATLGHVISNVADAGGIEYAQLQNIPTTVVDHTAYQNRDAFEVDLAKAIDNNNSNDDKSAPLVLLAGFMRVLGGQFTQQFENRLINIHPSLLPLHRGLNTHARAIDAADEWHGCSVHFVNEALDGGPVIAQARVPVHDDDTAESLASRVLTAEHQLYPLITQMCINRQIECQNGHVKFHGKTLINPLSYLLQGKQLEASLLDG